MHFRVPEFKTSGTALYKTVLASMVRPCRTATFKSIYGEWSLFKTVNYGNDITYVLLNKWDHVI